MGRRWSLSGEVGMAIMRADREGGQVVSDRQQGPAATSTSTACRAQAVGELCAVRPGSVRVIVLHPRDRSRGYLPTALDRIRRCLDLGLAPIRFTDLLEGTP